jgi:hypothetical protein
MSERHQAKQLPRVRLATVAAFLVTALSLARAEAASFEEVNSVPFGTFGGVEYVLHAGRFTGETSRGPFRVPFEIVAPADPADGNGRVLFEPPHFLYRAAGRSDVIGPELLFGRGFSHATVGFSDWGFNRLDLAAEDLLIAGQPVGFVPIFDLTAPLLIDIEILDQFSEALTVDPIAAVLVGEVSHLYAYGVSQTAQAMLELLYQDDVAGRFDLTLLHVVVWNTSVRPDFAALPVPFVPFDGSEKTLFVETEGDQLISQSAVLRGALAYPGYRLYEIAGSAHLPLSGPVPGLPLEFNSLDHLLVARAAFVAGDEWAARGIDPPPSITLDVDASGGPDPVYGFPTGIARDADGNARGGVRLPNLAVGAAHYIASLPLFLGVPAPDLIFALSGAQVDLSCTPSGRFRNHGEYVRAVTKHASDLRRQRYLLPADAEALVEAAAESATGKAGACAGTP